MNRMKLPHILFLACLTAGLMLIASFQAEVRAQKATASLDTTSIRLGEQVQLQLNVTLPSAANVIWPRFTDSTFSPVEILHASKVDTIETSRNNYLQYKQFITITSFDSGYHVIPPISVEYQMKGDLQTMVSVTDSLILHVRTVDVDTTRAIKDIKGNMEAPITLAELWPVFAGIAIVGLIAGFIWYYLWRKKMKKPLFPVIKKAQLPPWQLALENLDIIEAKKLWQNGKYKEYHTEVTDVLRVYLESQFRIPAMEMISSEIMDAFQGNDQLKPFKEKVWQVLQLADLVKFAKEVPIPAENVMSLENSRAFIIETKPTENPEPQKEVTLTKEHI
ncbi:MAG: hypothetical protein IPH84_07150 [Bacteroidales bacterium]|nr:hypothetical protein [Bacteroidales bacterium]